MDDELTPHEFAVVCAIRDTYASLQGTARHLSSVRFVCFLWNLGVSTRIARFGSRVLVGDFVIAKEKRDLLLDAPPTLLRGHIEVVTEDNLDQFTIFDVVHPFFCFGDAELPKNAVKDIYHAICERFNLSWSANYKSRGITDFIMGPRRIAIQPDGVTCETDEAAKTATVEFMLPRGSYATVVLRELFSAPNCANAEVATFGKRPAEEWERGASDPTYVESLDDIYVTTDFETGESNHDVALPADDDTPVWELPEDRLRQKPDPARSAVRFALRNFDKALVRREKNENAVLDQLFEPALKQQLSPDERKRYMGHGVPRRANVLMRQMRRSVQKRQRNLQGTVALKSRFVRNRHNSSSRRHASHELLTGGTWNVG